MEMYGSDHMQMGGLVGSTASLEIVENGNITFNC